MSWEFTRQGSMVQKIRNSQRVLRRHRDVDGNYWLEVASDEVRCPGETANSVVRIAAVESAESALRRLKFSKFRNLSDPKCGREVRAGSEVVRSFRSQAIMDSVFDAQEALRARNPGMGGRSHLVGAAVY